MAGNGRLLLRRAHAQQTLLLAVLAVALVGATVLGTFALLLATSQHHLLSVALDRATPAEREIDVTLNLQPGGADTGAAALAHGTQFLDELLGDVPATREEWLTSPMYTVQGTDDLTAPYVYLAATPQAGTSSTLVSGALPTTGVDDDGRVLVAVPQVAADAYGWSVGSVVQVKDSSSRKPAQLVVTGTFTLTGATTTWARDPLAGAEHDADYPVLGSAGMLRTHAWGPFVVGDPAVLTDGSARLGIAHLVAHPELATAPTHAVDALRGRLDQAQQHLGALTAADRLDSTSRPGSTRPSTRPPAVSR